jgi:hypothetical protein
MRFYIAPLVLILSNGCGVINEQAVYEGLRSHQKAKNVGIESKQPALPSYQQYQNELKTLKQ